MFELHQFQVLRRSSNSGKTAISGESFSHEKEHEMIETFKRSDSVLLDARCVQGGTCWTLLDRNLELDVDNFLENYLDTKKKTLQEIWKEGPKSKILTY